MYDICTGSIIYQLRSLLDVNGWVSYETNFLNLMKNLFENIPPG